MATGTVKWFNDEKRFGFIRPTRAVRTCSFTRADIAQGSTLEEGAKVSYDAEDSDRGPKAVNVKPA